ncbi:GIN domain-containing protein [Microbacterium sp. NPDC057650]|uniref:GIN domain-containing protein n=1 Tax=unclassified Microbacterium TaxID=2609290 RepID=UPI00366B9BC5
MLRRPLSAVALSGCSLIQDSGPSTTQQRDVEGITAVELDTSGDLTVTLGEATSLSVTAGEKVINRLTSTVEDGTLRLGVSGQTLSFGGEIRYELTVPSLESIVVQGSGDADVDLSGATAPVITVKGSGEVTATGLTADTASITVDGSGSVEAGEIQVQRLTVRIDGSGEITANGGAASQSVDIRGSGDYHGSDLRSTDAKVVVRGAGGAHVHVTGDLVATIDGSGDIRHSGGAHVTKDVSGSGEVVAD